MKGRLSNLRGEAGIGLVEVMVSAVVIVIVATATVSSIANSQKTSSRTLARGVTAVLAEAEQERLRSMRASDLVDYSSSSSRTMENVDYQVDSYTEFVQGPDAGTVSCASTGDQSRFMRMTTTVTPEDTNGATPLTIRSFQALPVSQFSPNSGTLVVKILQRDGTTGQPGITVSLTGPDSRSAATNSEGCAIFQFLRPGSYSGAVNRSGYVGINLVQSQTFSGTVSAGTINQTTPFLYDRAGSITPRWNTTRTSTLARGITVNNGGIPSPSSRTFITPTPTSPVATSLFPFIGPYTAYSGRCAPFNDPTRWEPNFYTDAVSAGYGLGIVNPGANTIVNLREPTIPITVRLQRAAGQTFNTPQLYVRQMDTGCNGTDYHYDTTSSAYTVPSGTTAGTFSAPVVNRALPYGRYWICAAINKTGGTGTNGVYTAAVSNVQNTRFNGPTTAPSVTINATTTSGTMNPCVTGTGNRWSSVVPLT